MSALLYSSAKIHSRYESKKSMSTAPSRSNLLLSPNANSDAFNFSYGLQGSGKFTDNAFKTSLRSDTPSAHVLQRLSRSREPGTPSSANECLSARSLKASLLGSNKDTSNKASSRVDIERVLVVKREPRTKENKSLKPTSSLAMLLKKKPKFEGQPARVLKDSNRELSLHKRGNTPQCSSLSTEQDSSYTSILRGPTVDINQQLRNIFQVGAQKVSHIEDYGYPIPEEKKEIDAFRSRILNTSCVRKPNLVQSVKKF